MSSQLSHSLLCRPSYGATEKINLNQTTPPCFILGNLSAPACSMFYKVDPAGAERGTLHRIPMLTAIQSKTPIH